MKKSIRLITCLIASSMTLTLLATGCGNKATTGTNGTDSKVASIKWTTWGNPDENARFKSLNEDFNKKNTDVKAEFVSTPGDGYEQKILTQVAAKTAPDLFYSGDGSIEKFIRDNRVLDLTPYMEKSATLKPDSIYENLYGAAKQNGKIYGVAVDCNPMVLYYNIDLLKSLNIKTPQEYLDEGKWNWDAFSEITRAVAKGGKNGFILPNWWGPQGLWDDSDSYGNFSEDGKKVTIDEPGKVSGIKYMAGLIKEKAVTYAGALPKGQGDDAMFMSGQVAMVTAGRWYVPEFKKITAFKWDVVPYPTTASGKKPVVGIPTAYLCINKDTKNPEAAFKFLEQFINKDGQLYRLKDGGNAIPTYKDADLDKQVMSGDVPLHQNYFLDARATGKMVSFGVQAYPEAAQSILDTLDLVWLGKMDAETAVKQAKTKAEAAIAKQDAKK